MGWAEEDEDQEGEQGAWMGIRSDAVCGRLCSACSASRASRSRPRISRTAGGISRSDSTMPARNSARREQDLAWWRGQVGKRDGPGFRAAVATRPGSD